MRFAAFALAAACWSTAAHSDECANAAFNMVAAQNVLTVCAGIYLTPKSQADQPQWPQILAGCSNRDQEMAIARAQVQRIVNEQQQVSRACAFIAETANVQTGQDVFAGHK